MADEKAEAEEAAEGGETEKKGGKKKLILIAAAVVLLLGGGGAAYFMLAGGSEAPPPQGAGEAATQADSTENTAKDEDSGEGSAEKEGGDKKASEDKSAGSGAEEEGEGTTNIKFGSTIDLKPFHLNLGNPLENRFVRIEIALEYKQGPNHLNEIKARLPQIRDAVISVISRKTREFLLGADGKDQLRHEILIRINEHMQMKIESVFITDLLIE